MLKLLKSAVLYLVHVIAATRLSFWGAQFLAFAFQRFLRVIDARPAALDSAGHLFIHHLAAFCLTAGLIAGYANTMKFKHQQATWVWIFPAAYLLWQIVAFHPSSVLEHRWISAFSHYFGAGCIASMSIREALAGGGLCFDQIDVTALFYTSLAYSLGAFLYFCLPKHQTRPEEWPLPPNLTHPST